MTLTLTTFVLFTGLVAFLTWWITRGKGTDTEDGFFLAGRSLTGVVIAGSLLLTNLSTEQLVGLNGAAFKEGLSVMAWEVIAGCSLVVMALYFLPRYLKSGITTIPQFLEERYGSAVRATTTGIFIVAYMLILLPFVLFSGAKALSTMLDLPNVMSLNPNVVICMVVAFIAIVGSAYAIFGGLRAVAVSDLFNGIGLLIGGLLLTYFALSFAAGDGSIFSVFAKLRETNPDALHSIPGRGPEPEDISHWSNLFTGVLLLNFFYWCTNQQIIQRTFGAKNLVEGQKGVLLAAFFKILAPIILIVPGIAAMQIALDNADFVASITNDQGEQDGGSVYGSLVRLVLPAPLTGFFAAVLVGSILSTFNSVLNSSATLFSLGIYKTTINPGASNPQTVRSGRICSAAVAVFAAIAAPAIFMNIDGLFGFFQKLNAVYFIPLLAIILVGMFNRNASGKSALITIATGLVLMSAATFFSGNKPEIAAVFNEAGKIITPEIAAVPGWVNSTFGSGYHYMGAVFALLIALQLSLGTFMRRETPYVQADAGILDLTPWKHAKLVGGLLIGTVLLIYLLLAL